MDLNHRPQTYKVCALTAELYAHHGEIISRFDEKNSLRLTRNAELHTVGLDYCEGVLYEKRMGYAFRNPRTD